MATYSAVTLAFENAVKDYLRDVDGGYWAQNDFRKNIVFGNDDFHPEKAGDNGHMRIQFQHAGGTSAGVGSFIFRNIGLITISIYVGVRKNRNASTAALERNERMRQLMDLMLTFVYTVDLGLDVIVQDQGAVDLDFGGGAYNRSNVSASFQYDSAVGG